MDQWPVSLDASFPPTHSCQESRNVPAVDDAATRNLKVERSAWPVNYSSGTNDAGSAGNPDFRKHESLRLRTIALQ